MNNSSRCFATDKNPALTWATLEQCEAYGIRPMIVIWAREWIRHQLAGMDLSGSVLLDLGSHTSGPLSHWYCPRVRHSFLLDLHHPPGVFANATGVVHDLEAALPFPSDSFDIVISASTFQFLSPAGARLQMREIERVLRPGGMALITLSWMHPLNEGVLEILAREPELARRKIFYKHAPDVNELLRQCSLLQLDGDGEVEKFPGVEPFSAEVVLCDPALLVKNLTNAATWNFRPETVEAGVRQLAVGMRLKKVGDGGGARPVVIDVLPRVMRFCPEIPAGARVLELNGQDLHLGQMEGRYEHVILRGCLHCSDDPAQLLAAVARHTDQLWIDDVLVDSQRRECAFIAATDIAEKSCLKGRMRISVSWVYRELMALNFQPVVVESNPLADGQAKRVVIRATPAKRLEEYPPVLVHVHLPKNAGTSFNRLLANNFGERFVRQYSTDPQHHLNEVRLSEMLRSVPQAAAVASHSFGVFPSLVADRRLLYITFVRHPLARHRSYWRYAKQRFQNLSAKHRTHLPADFPSMTADDFTHFIADLAEARLMKMQTELISGRDDVESAIAALSKFFFVGVVEQFDHSLTLLREKLSVTGIDLNIENCERANSTTTEIDDLATASEAEARLLLHLKSDLELHRWATERLEISEQNRE